MHHSARICLSSQQGGTPLDDIRDTANSKATLTIGGWVQEPGAGDYLEKEFEVPHIALPLPLGLEFTDRLAANLEELTGLSMPESYERERGRLLDTMVDAHKLLADVKTAVYGDTEMVLGITRIMTELGMRPQIVATGAANPAFAEKAEELAPGSKVMTGADFSQIAAGSIEPGYRADGRSLYRKRDCQKGEDTALASGTAQS